MTREKGLRYLVAGVVVLVAAGAMWVASGLLDRALLLLTGVR